MPGDKEWYDLLFSSSSLIFKYGFMKVLVFLYRIHCKTLPKLNDKLQKQNLIFLKIFLKMPNNIGTVLLVLIISVMLNNNEQEN